MFVDSTYIILLQITLGELTVEEKSNDITAVPELLDLIDIEGAIITADAMSCQKKIVSKITENKADYTIGLKNNQPMLYKDVADYFSEFEKELSVFYTRDKGHGRIEKHEYRLLTDISWLEQKDDWAGIQAVGMVKSAVWENDEEREFIRYFITSLTDIN